jgi:transcriptional regulator GlxA family with amidase domain
VDRVASAASPVDQLRAFERALEGLVAETSAPSRDHTVDLALRAMRASARPLRVERLANLAGISRRQFERRFRQEVGLSPNLFGRIVRFQHAFAAVATEPGASLAARLGFVDQAHLVREVRRFSGQTPTLLANARGLTTFFANAAS